MSIQIIAKSGISILAVVVLFTMIKGITQNSQSIIDVGQSMFWGVISAIIIVTVIINLPKIIRIL